MEENAKVPIGEVQVFKLKDKGFIRRLQQGTITESWDKEKYETQSDGSVRNLTRLRTTKKERRAMKALVR